MEIRSQNELTAFGFAKDYDAIVTVRTDIGERRFALEYERTRSQRNATEQSLLHEPGSSRESAALFGCELRHSAIRFRLLHEGVYPSSLVCSRIGIPSA